MAKLAAEFDPKKKPHPRRAITRLPHNVLDIITAS